MKKLFLNNHFILLLIIINSVVIFIQEFDGIPYFVNYIDNVFTILFGVELLIKVNCFGLKNYLKSNWNRLDFILIISALLSLFLEIVDFQYVTQLGFLTSLRVLRLFKSFRLIKFVPNIGSIIAGVNHAVKASYVVVLAFIILLFIISILTCSLFKGIVPEYFDNPFQSLYSTFRVFSIEGWYEIPDLIAERTSSNVAFFSKLYFVLLLFGGGILGMSLINSIFVDAMVSDNNEELEKRVEELSEKMDRLITLMEENKLNKE